MSLSRQLKSSKTDFLGEGSYGCVYYPGITCKGKKNKKNLITKIQEINFYSDNEKNNGKYIKANIKNYSKYLSPVIKYCIVKFNTVEKSGLNISKCNILFDEYNSSANINYGDIFNNNNNNNNNNSSATRNSLVNEQYILMYSSYIKGYTLKDYYSNYNTEFVSSILSHSYKILYGISLLNNVGIIHNDLHIGNVLINLKNLNPVIIDFGLSFNINNCYKLSKDYIDFQYIKRFVHDYREDSYHINIEKRFISFIIYNRTSYFPSEIFDNNDSNNISKAAIKYFISDAINSINNNKEIRKFFTNNELIDFQTALEQFYYQFLDKSLYPKYNSVVKYLLDFVYMYNDLHSLTIDLLYLVELVEYHKQALVLNNEEQIILDFFMQLYKKSLYPNPNMRLNISEVLDIYKFIINFMKNYDLKTAKNNIRATMISELVKFLKSKNISIKTVFYKNFAFLNFNLLCNDLIFETIKSSSISL
jgi:serine/threonine protein kinase